MAVVSDVLRPFWLPGISEVCGLTTTSFKAWLTEGNFVFVNQPTPVGEWQFYTGDSQNMLRAIAHDFGRMSSASFESICAIPAINEIPRSSAWSLIRCYYAAFFAAHAISRIFGEALTQIETSQKKALSKAIQANGGNTKIDEGLHLFKIDINASTFTIYKLQFGSHEDTWHQFSRLLDKLSSDILIGTSFSVLQSRQEVNVLLGDILDIMKTSPFQRHANWLSHIRNEINYQHRHGAWYPHDGSKKFRDQIGINISHWRKNPAIGKIKPDATLLRFSEACAALVGIARELVIEMSNRNSNNDSFLKHGALIVLKQA